MSKRNTQQRRHAILSMVNEQGEVSVDTLAKHFATSEVTVRKDLAELEKNGLLLRRYGGAVSIPTEMVSEPEEQVSVRKLQLPRPPLHVSVTITGSLSIAAAPQQA